LGVGEKRSDQRTNGTGSAPYLAPISLSAGGGGLFINVLGCSLMRAKGGVAERSTQRSRLDASGRGGGGGDLSIAELRDLARSHAWGLEGLGSDFGLTWSGGAGGRKESRGEI